MDVKVEELIDKVGSKYLLTSICAKRAHEINSGDKILIEDVAGKSDIIALKEIALDRIIIRSKDSQSRSEKPAKAEKK